MKNSSFFLVEMVRKSDGLVFFLLILFAFGVYTLYITNNWKHKWENAILIKEYVYKSLDFKDTYYIKQEFLKSSNTTDTCIITRSHKYKYRNQAINFINNAKLNTTRTIYQRFNNKNACFDNSIRYEDNFLGFIIVLFSAFSILFICYLSRTKESNDDEFPWYSMLYTCYSYIKRNNQILPIVNNDDTETEISL